MSAPTVTRGAQRRPAPRRALRSGLRVAVILLLGIPLLVGLGTAAGFGALLFGNLPGTVPEEKPRAVSQPSYVYDANGNQIASFRQFDLNIPLIKADIPQVMKDAVVAAEDHKFWTHKGVDPEGLVRAGITNYREGETVQGGSTITQQLVKNVYLTGERSVSRKLNEAVLATRLERDLTDEYGSRRAAKEEILFRYLNTTYFGSGAYGAEAAAQSYFRKDLKDLNISEAAALAAIIPAPSKYGPRDDLFKAEARRGQVLDEMHDQGMISDAQWSDAKAKFLWPFGFGDPGGPTTAFYPPPENGAAQYPYFVDYVRTYLTAKYGDKYGEDFVYKSGLKIETTVDPKLQQLADQAVTAAVGKAEPTVAMALVSLDPSTGYVKAMVGGRDFAANQVNLATGGTLGMQPGSSMKPYTMATALEQGITPDTVYPATTAWPVPGGCIKTKNNSCVIQGEAASTMGPAIAESSNTYFAQLAYDVGPNNIAKMANRLGVSRIDPTKKDYNVTLTLGTSEVSPLDQAVGYATFENHGVRNDPTPVVKVTLPDGTVLEDNTERTGTQVLNANIADTVTDLLRGPTQAGGTAAASLSGFGRPVAGKTGTTEYNDNAWFIGFTPQLSTAVWLGHIDGNRTLAGFGSGRVFGGTVPAATWKAFMKPALDGQPVLDFPKPGPLPVGGGAPGGELDPSSRRPNTQTVPDVPHDCGGPCVVTPALTTPPTTPPPTTPPTGPTPTTPAPGSPPSTTLGITTPTTTKKAKSP